MSRRGFARWRDSRHSSAACFLRSRTDPHGCRKAADPVDIRAPASRRFLKVPPQSRHSLRSKNSGLAIEVSTKVHGSVDMHQGQFRLAHYCPSPAVTWSNSREWCLTPTGQTGAWTPLAGRSRTIYRLYCEKLEAPPAIKIVEMLIIIGVVG